MFLKKGLQGLINLRKLCLNINNNDCLKDEGIFEIS